MRDIVFLVADLSMQEALKGFLTRSDCYHAHNLCTSCFQFDPTQDLFYAAGGFDPGLYCSGHELLRPFQNTHRHAVVIQDAEWEGSPGAAAIRNDLTGRIVSTGWAQENFKVIVIEPELEAWIWQRNQRVATPLGFSSVPDMIAAVTNSGLLWPTDQAKPSRPKEALEAVVRQRRIGWSSAIHRSITASVSLVGCQDPAFLELQQTLRQWFPLESSQ